MEALRNCVLDIYTCKGDAMNLNPTSPLSGRPLYECDDWAINAWIDHLIWPKDGTYVAVFAPTPYTTSGDAALALMQTEEWPDGWSVVKIGKRFAVRNQGNTSLVTYLFDVPAAAITRAWLVAAEARRANNAS